MDGGSDWRLRVGRTRYREKVDEERKARDGERKSEKEGRREREERTRSRDAEDEVTG